MKQKEAGDDEAQGIDETFVNAYVLPDSDPVVDWSLKAHTFQA
jgi:hypothetical protein